MSLKVISKLRSEDERRSNIVSDFMDNIVYTQANGFEDVQRITDRQNQCKGIDIIFTKDKKKYVCDEKAAIRYINKNLRTFSFELSFLNRLGYLTDGWLLNDKNVNDSYMCIWIDDADNETLPSIDSIKSIQCALISKNIIFNYLLSIRWDKEKLFTKCQNILNNPNENCGNIRDNGIKFSFSTKLVEKPVNVLISRDKLIELADYVFTI